jgi:hypothetical protein
LYTPFVEQTARIVLPHATGIKVLKAKGYKLVTVAECLEVQPYLSVSAPQSVSFVTCRRCLLPLLFVFKVHGHANRDHFVGLFNFNFTLSLFIYLLAPPSLSNSIAIWMLVGQMHLGLKRKELFLPA